MVLYFGLRRSAPLWMLFRCKSRLTLRNARKPGEAARPAVRSNFKPPPKRAPKSIQSGAEHRTPKALRAINAGTLTDTAKRIDADADTDSDPEGGTSHNAPFDQQGTPP